MLQPTGQCVDQRSVGIIQLIIKRFHRRSTKPFSQTGAQDRTVRDGLAAMGIPPFGVFAGFMGLLLTAPPSSTIGLFIALTAWLAASWYIMQMVQQLLFGTRRPDLRYADLRRPEFTSLLIVVLALLALGLAPTSLYAPDQTPNTTVAMKRSLAWNR